MTGRIHSIESLGALDGPGIRMVVFFQGCPLRCIYCHNPDTWAMAGGSEMTVDEILRRARRLRPYFGEAGGVTLSGGEPLAQPEFALALIRALHTEGIHVAVDTSGGADSPAARAVLDAADLILLDIKAPEAARYREITDASFDTAQNLRDHLKTTGKPLWIRQVYARGLNDSAEEIESTRKLMDGLNVIRFERLPYHAMGAAKWEALGLAYPGKNLEPPTNELTES